jgi:hypothetical protein
MIVLTNITPRYKHRVIAIDNKYKCYIGIRRLTSPMGKDRMCLMVGRKLINFLPMAHMVIA